MFVSADQLVIHALGDYVFQSDYMASEKSKKSLAALIHAVTYTLSFLFLTQSWKALLVIAGTHFLIDRFRLARYVCWVKNFLAPKYTRTNEYITLTTGDMPSVLKEGDVVQIVTGENEGRYIVTKTASGGFVMEKTQWWHFPWKECSATGYSQERPIFLSFWLMIIADNLAHILLNALALKYL